jgi:MFS family permease
MTARAGRRDARLIYTAGFLRSAGVSLVGVTLAIHLADVGFSTPQIGGLIGLGLAGSSLATLVVSLRGDVWGRRRVMVALAVLTATGYVALGASTAAAALMPLAFVGMLNGMGRDRGAASVLDQAMLPQTVPEDRRTWALAWYNVVLDAGHAAGALAATAPTILMRILAIDAQAAHQLTFAACAAAMLCSVAPYLALSPHIEAAPGPSQSPAPATLDPGSRRVIARLALLFGLDSLGGGFLNSALISYWFFRQFGLSEADLAIVFFTARVLNAISHLAAAWLARHIGLLNTMVWTHLPSSVLLMVAPASPSAAVAVALFLAREAVVEMDVPTRQSYVLAVVAPTARTAASGITNLTRNVAWAVGPSVAGMLMQHVALATPLVVGGTLKIAYDLLLYRSFRHVRPPEEQGPIGGGGSVVEQAGVLDDERAPQHCGRRE